MYVKDGETLLSTEIPSLQKLFKCKCYSAPNLIKQSFDENSQNSEIPMWFDEF